VIKLSPLGIKTNDIQDNDTQHNYKNATLILKNVMHTLKLSVAINFNMLSVNILNVVMLYVVAPNEHWSRRWMIFNHFASMKTG
jgi:hypothetical protein